MKVATLTTGDDVETIINQPFVPEYILIGTIDTDLPLTKLDITIEGENKQQISEQSLIQAISKIDMGRILGADVKVGQLIRVADGYVGGVNIQVRLTNADATTPDIYFFSTKSGSRAAVAGMVTIQDLSSQLFSGFSKLFFDPANLDYAQVDFTTHTEKMSAAELAGMFTMMNVTDADGKLAGILAIENIENITGVTLYANGGSISVLSAVM